MSHRILLRALFACVCGHEDVSAPELKPAFSSADSPLKKLVPYSGMAGDTFPRSMEFDYLSLSDLINETETFDWQPLEALLSGIASRGNQVILRVWREYPWRKSGMPTFLRDQGVKVT